VSIGQGKWLRATQHKYQNQMRKSDRRVQAMQDRLEERRRRVRELLANRTKD